MALPATLEEYETERADFERLVHAIRTIQSAAEADLLDVEWLVKLVRTVGLAPIPDFGRAYGEEAIHVNGSQQGVVQLPREFATCLRHFAEARPATFLEIGAFNGAAASLAAAYLRRFSPQLRAVTIDIFPHFIFYQEAHALLPFLEYHVGRTSFDFQREMFDAVFIDGDHTFEWAWADYQNVGRNALVCALHDIKNAPYLELPLGGVPAAWELIKRTQTGGRVHEIVEHPTAALLGIGIRSRSPLSD